MKSADRQPFSLPASTVRGAAPIVDHPRTVVFGGTFDPPHRGHIDLPLQAARALGAQRIVFLPAGRSPFKLHHEQSPPADRLAMLRLAVDHAREALEPGFQPRLEIDATETKAGDGRPSYTIDTLRRLHAERPGERFFLLIGTDQLFVFPAWHEAEALAALAPPAVMVRPPAGHRSVQTWLESKAPLWLRARARLVEVDSLDLSSTELRAAIAKDEAPVGLCPRVLAYARSRRLYEP